MKENEIEQIIKNSKPKERYQKAREIANRHPEKKTSIYNILKQYVEFDLNNSISDTYINALIFNKIIAQWEMAEKIIQSAELNGISGFTLKNKTGYFIIRTEVNFLFYYFCPTKGLLKKTKINKKYGATKLNKIICRKAKIIDHKNALKLIKKIKKINR